MGLAPLGASYKNVKIIVSCCVKEKDDNEVTELRISSFQKNNVIFSLYFTVIIFSAKQNPRKSLELEGSLPPAHNWRDSARRAGWRMLQE